MKRFVYITIASMMSVILISLNAFAMPYNPRKGNVTSVNEVSKLLPPNVERNTVTVKNNSRGNFFASADLTVKNLGHGNVGAYAVALCRYPVDQVFITIYLDKFDEAAERWRQVDYYESEFYAEDYPEGLTSPVVDMAFTHQEKGKYYRLRASFAAGYNGEYESFTPSTDGVLLD